MPSGGHRCALAPSLAGGVGGRVLVLPEKAPGRPAAVEAQHLVPTQRSLGSRNPMSFGSPLVPTFSPERPRAQAQWRSAALPGGLDPHFLGKQASRDLGRSFGGAASSAERQLGCACRPGPAGCRGDGARGAWTSLSCSGDLSTAGPQAAEGGPAVSCQGGFDCPPLSLEVRLSGAGEDRAAGSHWDAGVANPGRKIEAEGGRGGRTEEEEEEGC